MCLFFLAFVPPKKFDEEENKEVVGGSLVKITEQEKMATLRPKSPKPIVEPKPGKDESIWDKLGTLGRKKRIKEGNYIGG